MIKRLILALGVASLVLSAPQEQNRQMAEMYKVTQPGSHHAQMESLAGNWSVAVSFKVGPGAERKATAGSEAQWILGGRFLRQHYKSDSGLEVWQFLGYDNQKKKFFEIKMDNMETGSLFTEGVISEDGRVITNYGDRTDPMSGHVARLRTVTTMIDHDHYNVEWFLGGANGVEEKIVTMEHTRRP